MRGQVLGVDRRSGEGQIAGDDGRRYSFRPADWSDRVGPAVGALVDFEAEQTRALRIYHQPGTAVAAPGRAGVGDRDKIIAALLAFFAGTLGIHRFYLRRKGSGIAMLLLSCTVVGLAVTVPWAFIDMVRYLLMSDAEFTHRYEALPPR
ncbi:TM2 domain-containing membrane protein YozV [Sphingomonas jejuensis]|uniref:TM2 domain-containing membrane protein YozV n=1 Tax=Sphingomonas jejuensis TaxID=904715 RepID=A0ABX0XHD4_9SPHN|nr:TM2 domain-containing protein [Sphingomonas jejuensis]NJC32743.1 TM2 domain-containing membrane protein YozV [Sphingomonas jejuensis]